MTQMDESTATSPALERWTRWMTALGRYHKSVAIGAENIPREGGVVLLGTHSLASYELFVICCFSLKVIKRRTLIVGDDLMFKIPGWKKPLEEIGFLPGNRDNTIRVLKSGEMVGIAPGGMLESLRPSTKKYTYDWSRRRGFAAVAMKAGVPVVPTVCPAADDIFTVYSNPITPFLYDKLRIPVPIFRGRGLTAVPRPVKLVHWIGKPLYADVAPDQFTDRDVEHFHGRIVGAVNELVAQAVATGTRVEGLGAVPLGWA